MDLVWRQPGGKGNPVIWVSRSLGRGISWRKSEVIDVVGGSVEKALVEDKAGKAGEGTVSPVYRSRSSLGERSSSDLAPCEFQNNWTVSNTDAGSGQGMNTQTF